MGRLRDFLFRLVVYAKRGHSSWFTYLFGLANFIVIQYRLLVQYVPALEAVFPSLTSFLLVFAVSYLAVAVVVGWWDYKKATVATEAQVNPYFYKPTGKEVVVYAPYFKAVLTCLEHIAEREGLKEDVESIRRVKSTIEHWVKS